MRDFLGDLRYGWRTLSRSPGFTAVAVLTLALGIGANTAIWSLVDAVLLRPLPFPEPDRLVLLWERATKVDLERMWVALPNFQDWRARNRVFAEMAAYRTGSASLTGGGEPEQVRVAQATAGLFPLLGVRAAVGRIYGEAEDRPGAPPVVVLSDGLWRRRFGADPRVVGRAVTLDGEPYTVAGVLPRDFHFPGEAPGRPGEIALWAPLARETEDMGRTNHPGITAIARLRPGVTPERARAAMMALAAELRREHPEVYDDGVTLAPLTEEVVGEVRPALLVLLAAVALVLLIACANLANLLLARAGSRRREVAVRTALGAGRGRLLRQHLTESLLLALFGGAAGVLVAEWGLELLSGVAAAVLPRIEEVGLDFRALAFTAVAALSTWLLFGLAPALQGTVSDVSGTLRATGVRAGGGRRGLSLRAALVVAELALAAVLVIGAGLLLKSFVLLARTDPGFAEREALTLRISLPEARYPEDQKRREFFDRVLHRAAVLPGVRGAALVSDLPLGGGSWQSGFDLEGRPRAEGELSPLADFEVVSPDYFRTLGIPVRSGRAFSTRDREGAPPVAIVDETFARRFWPAGDAVGRRLGFHDEEGTTRWREIVGVVGHVRHHGLDAESRIQVYLPFAQVPVGSASLVLASLPGADPAALAGAARRAVLAVDPEQPVSRVATLREVLAGAVGERRLGASLVGLFAALALALGALGVYGVMAWSVGERRHEIGVRMALGARPADVARQVVGQAGALTAAGLALGLAAALALTRLLASQLYGVGATDPLIFAATPLVLAGVGLAAAWLPARRAARVDPATALNAE